MENLTCDVCGKVCKKPSSLLSHKRWAHGGGSPTVTRIAELAEYRALNAKVTALATQVNDVVRQASKRVVPVAAPVADKVAPVADSGSNVGGALLILALLGSVIWANTTEAGRAAMAKSEALRVARRRA